MDMCSFIDSYIYIHKHVFITCTCIKEQREDGKEEAARRKGSGEREGEAT
jgi:hypothetical protein